MKTALIGSVSSSLAALEGLIENRVEVTCCLGVDVSQQERISDYADLQPIAERAGIPFTSFRRIREPAVAETLRQHPADLLFVIGLSQLVPESLVSLFPAGAVGFHPTLLPEGRGRAPVAWTILLQRPAAVNLFFLTDEADAGDIIVQREVDVLPDDYSEDLIARTNGELRLAIAEIAPAIRAGRLPREPQDHSRATHYAKRTPADGLIDWAASTDQIYRLVRAAGRPYPGAFTFHGERKVTVWRGRPLSRDRGEPIPGYVTEEQGLFIVGTGDGYFALTEYETADQAETLKSGDRLTAEPTALKGTDHA